MKEIIEKLIEMMTAESEWVKTGIELEEVHNGIRRVAEGVAPHVKRLLADERKPMECGHPKACIEYVPEAFSEPGGTALVIGCSACAEREKVKKLCANAAWNFMVGGGMYDEDDVADEIRGLDLTKDLAPSTEEEKGNV